MSYINNCKKYRQDIIDRFEPAYVIEKFFSENEIQTLMDYQFQNAKRVKARPTSCNIQSVVSMQRLFRDNPWLTDKFTEAIGKFDDNSQTGNYYITNQLHDAHVDLISEEEVKNDEYWAIHSHDEHISVTNNIIPWKSVVFPLFLSYEADCYTAYMHQRRIGYATTFDRDYLTEQADSSYTLARNYDGFIDVNGNPLPNTNDSPGWTEEKYPLISKENFSGFSEEAIFRQVTGDVMVFDACQIHASCQLPNSEDRWMKNGMNIQFYKSIE
jgi:hypothetical protein